MKKMQVDNSYVEKKFLSTYECVPLRNDDDNKKLIEMFDGGRYGKGVEKYLKTCAWMDDELDKTRVYLIKERGTERVSAYFSLRCGLLFSPYATDVNTDDRTFLELLVEAVQANDEETLADYKASGLYSDERFAKLLEEARSRAAYRKSMEGSQNDFNVKETDPAVEIHNLCRNHMFNRKDTIKAPFGFLVFWVFIAPIVIDIAGSVGCRYVYLFAAEKGRVTDDEEEHKLIEYYRNNWKFHDFKEKYVVRPYYDRECHPMVQGIDELRGNMHAIWEEFSDVLV